MTVIGITGSFGTGKTFVASVFKGLGAKVIDADRLARRALKKGSSGYEGIVSAFGEGILGKGRNIDRRKLAGIVFGDRIKLNRLNRIVHPGVISEIRRDMAGGRGVVVIDAPLLVEAKLTDLVDKLIVVKSSKENQIKRCVKKFGMKRGDVLKRIKSQMPLEKKERIADYVIDNNGSRAETKRQVLKIWRKVWR